MHPTRCGTLHSLGVVHCTQHGAVHCSHFWCGLPSEPTSCLHHPSTQGQRRSTVSTWRATAHMRWSQSPILLTQLCSTRRPCCRGCQQECLLTTGCTLWSAKVLRPSPLLPRGVRSNRLVLLCVCVQQEVSAECSTWSTFFVLTKQPHCHIQSC